MNLFHYLTGAASAPTFKKLLVAPMNMRERFLAMIRREIENKLAGRPARIVAKMNQLEDTQLCRALEAASQAGVPVDLIVRGFSSLRPGVPGWTENIRLRSIIGRFLEHSRIFYFANGSEDPLAGEYYIGSAATGCSAISHAAWRQPRRSSRRSSASGYGRFWTCACATAARPGRCSRMAAMCNSQPEPDADGPEAVGAHAWMISLAHKRSLAA